MDKKYLGDDATHSILKNFIEEFLPRSNCRKMYKRNEFSYIYYTLQKIFYQKLKIKIDPKEFAQCLNETGYHCCIMDKEYKRMKKALESININTEYKNDFFNYMNDFFLFVNVSPRDIRYLERAMKSTSLQKNPIEIIRLLFLKREIKTFFNRHLFA